MTADGELSTRRAAQVHAHLAACWSCRARMAELEATISAFARAYRRTFDPRVPPVAGPRALLSARLAELNSRRQGDPWRLLNLISPLRDALVLAMAVMLAAAGTFLIRSSAPPRKANLAASAFDRGVLPDRSLTPGVTRALITVNGICAMAHEEVVVEVSASLRREVLRRYGILDTRVSDYEIDYLIAPGLGGTDAIGNLWPEPYTSRIWNARVKDDLEERLHEMVCDGKLNLSEAQRDIATDWIAAYKKYFHTDRPLVSHSPFNALFGWNYEEGRSQRCRRRRPRPACWHLEECANAYMNFAMLCRRALTMPIIGLFQQMLFSQAPEHDVSLRNVV